MNTDKHTCVCATCGQGFTRKSSAIRHTDNLHSGMAMIVKPYDYIIGRLRGKFSPGDPAAFRRDRTKQTNSLVYDHHLQPKNNDTIKSGIHADVHAYESHPPQNMPYDSNKLVERNLMLDEFRILLYKNYPPQIAAQLFAQNTSLSNTAENNSYLESFLNRLRLRSGSA